MRLSFFALLICLGTAFAQPPRLIIRGDDMGISHSTNQALIECFQAGLQQSIEVIVPSPWFPEAVRLLAENPTADIGVHLTLTSEWDNLKWRPLTAARTLVDANGYFRPMVWPNPHYPGKALLENQWDLREIEAEFRAQIEMARRSLPNVTHLSDHMWCTQMAPEVEILVNRLAAEYGLVFNLKAKGVEPLHYDGPAGTAKEKVASFINALSKMEEGKTYLFLDHPAHDDAEMRAIHHTGYENVARDRAGVATLFTSPEVLRYIREKGIEVISYADLHD